MIALFVLLTVSFIARTSVVQSEALPLTAEIETKDTIHVYPSTVTNGAWAGVENVLTPDLSEDAIYQDFSARNAAYVPLSSAVVPQVNINAESGTVPAVSATTTASSSMNNTPLTPLPGEQTPPVDPLPQSSQNAEPSAGSAQQSSDTSEVPTQPVSLRKATENFFTIFSSVTHFLPFALLSDTQTTSTAAGSEAVPVSEGIASDTPPILPDQTTTGETATTANENATSSVQEPIPSTSPDESTSSPTNASVATSSNEASDAPTPPPPGSKTITLSDFSTPELSKGEYITSMQLRLSLAAKYIKHSDTEAPVITITYRTPSSTQEVGRITLDDEVSNAINGGYFLFALPNIADVSELAHASVEVTYSGDTQSLDGMYLDAAWLELNVAKVDPKLLKAKEAADLLKRMADPKLSTMISTERDFTREEAPRFSLRYQSQRNVIVRFVRNLLGRPLLQVDGVSVSHNGDGRTNLAPQISVTQDGLINVDFSDADKAHMEPGEYTVELHINEGGSVYTDSFTFQWGVLSINPDKTSYALGESANFSMGALSQNGNTICDADLSLYITDENDNAYAVPVVPSGECQGNNVVAVPDYSATFTPTLSGTYTMHLERLDADGNIIAHTEDTFLVEQDLPLSIRRVGPSRIYPDASYPMSLTVLSEAPWKGTLIEQVPATFDITDTDAKITKNGDTLLLSWDIDTASALSQTVSYTFNAPDLSPYLYTVGTASLVGESPKKIHVTDMSATQAATTSSTTTEAGQEEVIATSSNTTASEATGSAPIGTTTTSGTAEGGGQGESIIQKILDIFHIGGSDGTTTQTNPQGTSTPANVSAQPATSSVQNDQATGSTETSAQETPVQDASSSGLEGNVTPSDQLALTLTSTSTDANAASSSGNIVFSEHRVWQIASDATGNMILYWDGGTTLPSGWTCLSCGSGTFYQKFVMGGSTYNTTGGSATTTPTASGNVLAQSDPAVPVNTPGTGNGFALDTHTHTFTPTINGVSNLPRNRQLRVIEYTAGAGEPPTIPTGAIGIFDTSVPVGWTQYSAENNYYVYGGNSPGTTGGSNTVSHTISGTLGAAGGTVYRVRTGGTQSSVAAWNHTHTVSTTTPAIDHQPPFITAIFGKLNATTTPPNGMISMWTNTVPGGWLDESSAPTGAFYQRFIVGSSTYGVTGGTTTRTVADVNGIVTSAPSTVTTSRTGTQQNAADTSHTHLVNVTGFSAESNLPPYLTAIFGKRLGSGPIYQQSHYEWYTNLNSQTPTDPWSSGAAIDLGVDEQISATSSPVKNGEVVRLRIDVADSNATSTVGSTFKLQYGAGSTCSAIASWFNVGGTASSSIWRGYNNTSVTNAGTLATTTLASSTVKETYQEDGRATSTNAIPVGGIGEWDFVVQQNGATANTQYCFRMVNGDGSTFLGYSAYPTLLTDSAPDVPTLSAPFDNEQASSTLPGYTFYATDPESDDLDYEIQISTSNTFSTTVEDKDSVTNSTFFTNISLPSNKAPFTAGQAIQFAPTVSLTNGTTYWWRVRAKDTNGSNTWGGWSTPYSYTVNSSISASSWFQTTQDQFNEDTLTHTVTNGSGYVSLAVGSTTGSVASAPIVFTSGLRGTAWKNMKVSKNVAAGTLTYQLQYLTSTSSWANVPDSDLPGNSSGFSTSSVSLLNLDTSTYGELRLVASLTNVGGSPQLLDWTVNWGYRVNTPTLSSPFDNEKVSTTTPTFDFTTTDPLGNDLTYQISWSTSPDFTASTTRTSGVSAGFSDLDNVSDTDPFTSGNSMEFHLQPSDALTNGTTYWWRVRAKDTTGSNVYSFWSEAQSLTVDTSVTVSTWFQTTSDQFNTDSLSGTLPIAPGSVSVATTASEAMLVYGEGTDYQPKSRRWNGTSWGTQHSMNTIGAPLVRARVKAGTTRPEYVAATLGTDSDVNVQVYSNGTWGNLQNITTNAGLITSRPFDVTYETNSGRAMVVSCDNSANPIYYLWDGSSWTSGGSITTTLTANCSWIQLVSNPTSNEIILIVRATNGTVYEALVWNGSSWGNTTTLNRSSTIADEGMALQYEESANQALILGTNRANNNYMWRSWNGSAWSGTTNQAIGNDFEWGQVIQNVGNDLMTVCYQDASDHVGVVRWTGSAWTGQTTLQAGTGYAATDPGFSCVYEHDGTHNDNILLSYTTNTQTQYRTWNGAAWSAAAQINTMGPTITSALERTGTGMILGAFFDKANDRLLGANWNGSSWSSSQTLESNMSVNTSPFGLPYSIAPANPSAEGTVVGNGVLFSSGNGPYWQSFSWNDSKPGSSAITYQLQYYDGSTWSLIPDAALASNSTGLTSPVNLTGLNRITYAEIRPYATLSCDGSGNCPSINDWTINWAAGLTISGTAKQYDETTNVTSGTVAVAVNGVIQTGKTGAISGGTWSISNVNVAPGDVVTVFVSGAVGSAQATAVTRYDGIGNITGVKLFQHHLSLGSDDATSTPITNADIGLYDHTNSASIFDDVTGSTLYVCGTTGCGNAKFYIGANAFYTPGGSAHLHDLVNHGTLSATSSLYLNGSWTNSATSTMSGNTVYLEATSTTVSIDSTGATVSAFNNLTIGTTTGTATWNLATALTVNGNLSVKGGTLARGTQPITIGGNLSNQSSGLWSGSGTTTFNGASSATWSDANATLQNVGRIVIDGSAKSVTLNSSVKARSIKIGSDDFLNLGNSGYTLTDLGNFNNTHTLNAGNGTVQFSATTSTGLTLGSSALYNATFSGNGSFAFTDSAISISHNLSIATGTVTLPTGTTTISGSFSVTGGSFAHNNGTVYFNGSGSQSVTLLGTAFTNSLYDVKFGGSGTYTFTDANATTSHNFTKSAGTVVLPSGTMAIGGLFSNTSGSLTAGNDTLVLYHTGTSTVKTSGAALGSVKSVGSGPYLFTDTNITLAHSLSVVNGTVALPAGTLTLGGSLTNTGIISAGTGSILFNAGTTGNTVDPGASSLHAITFNNAAGAWTITGNATTTGNTTLTAGTFTLQSGKTLHVSGTFTNAMNAASTTWTGSTLALSGGTYSINTKTSGSDTYSTVAVSGSTHVSMWNSAVSTTTTDSSSSLYSQDNNAVDGDLYIWGNYIRTSGTEYWDYNKDFDGTPLTGSSTRAVHVYFKGGSYVTQTFTSNGTFTPPAGITKVDVLVVGGGGGGGAATGYTNAGAGGGGGGGVVYRSNYSVTPLTGVGITVGTGGTAGVGGNVSGGNGATSTFGSLTALGGGGGIGGNGNGKNGGSGGGARGGNGGTGTQPSSGSGGYGNRGGNSGGSPAGAAATGGGGAGGAGEDLAGVAGEKGGNGGAGLAYDISGTSKYYGGGGGGGAAQTSSPVGTGGSGVGGNGGNNGTAPIAGSANTGGGGGGGNNARAGAAGGSGVVVVRYAINPSFTLTGGTLEMLGTSTASTSIAGIGGAYAFDVTGGTVNAKYYQVRNGDDNGFSLSGTPVITSLDHGDFAIDGDGKAMITLSSTTIDANPGLQILSVSFATTTGVTSGYNVAQQDGTPSSYWWFRNSTGNFDGEAHDNDTGNPGSIRWDDSSLVLNVSGTVYSDDGVTPQAGGICDNVTNVIRLHVSSSGTNYDTHCSASNGTFTLSGVTVSGSPILTLFLNGTAGSNKAVVVTKTPTGNITNADIYMHRVILRHEDTDPLTIADMAGYDSSNDADIVFTAATGTTSSLTTAGNTELYLWHGKSFSPGGSITLSHSGTGSTYDGSLYLAASSTFTGAGTTTYSIGGSWREAAGATFIPASTTITFVATSSGKTISGAASSTINFNALAFTGTGSWNVNSAIALTGDMHIASGTVTGTGNITLHSGSLYGNGLLSMGGGTTTIEKSNTLGGTQGWTFHNLTLGNGTTVGTTTPGSTATTTISGRLKIATGHFLNAGSSVFDLSGSGTVFLENGTFLEGTSKLRYSGSGATTILSTGYYDLDLNAGAGSPTYTATGLGIQVHHNLTVGGQSPTVVDLNANDPALAVTGNVLIRSNGTVGASGSGSFTVGGNWDNSGTFTGNSGTVTFNGSGSPTINAGASSFGNVLINGTGSFTLTDNATSTGAFTIATTTGALTLSSGKTLSVGGVFSNGLGGANTTWTGSTLYLHSGTNYAINTKSVSDAYDTLKVGANTDIRMWNSQASTYAIDPSGSMYSMDHAGVDGSLYIYGNYPGSGSTDYWSYAKDFDGTSLGSPRSATVRFQSGASMDLVTGGLQVLGTSGASTTVENQGSGNYRLHIGGTASTSWSYYKVYNTDSSGLTISGTPNVLTLSRGYFEVSQASGTAMTVGGTAITANPAKTFTNDVFATTTAIKAFNVTATGTTVSSWRFTNHSGNLAGEAYDVDPDGDPGYIVWDDSAATITISGHVYSDEGSTVSAACDGTTADIHIRVAGLTTYAGSCNASTGAYAISGISFSPGDSLVAYISGKTQKAAAVTRDPVSNISDLDLYEHRVIVRHENTSALTIADMATWDSSDDSDIPFTATVGSPNTLTLPSNTKLIVWSNKTFAPGGNMTLSGGGAGAAYDGSLEVYTNGALTFAGTQSHSIGGSFVLDGGATFTPAQSTTTFTTTGAARTIDTNSTPFYNVAFTGSGSWSVTDPIFGIHTLVQSAGSLTLPTGTTTIRGSWIKNGGSLSSNGSLMLFTSTSTNAVKFGGSSVASLVFSGIGGSWNMTDTNATSTGAITIVHGGLTLPPGTLALRGSFRNLGGTITHNTDDLIFEGTSTATLLASSSDLYTVRVNGSGGLTMADHSLTLANSLIMNAGTTTLASGTLSIGGSLSAATGAFTNATGTILFNATTTGKTIDPGRSRFYNVNFGSASGGWTISNNATSTHNFTISSANSFTLQSGKRLFVGGVFTNSVGGSATTWTGSTLVLSSGNAYSINTKSAGGDNYNTLIVGANTDISAWNSHATTTTIASSSSLYSMDHAGVDGSLYIYGDYHISTTTQYWSYAKDFDGTTLTGGSERAVTVHLAAGATTTLTSGTLSIIGAAGSETTITNQGSGNYAFIANGGTLSAQYYKFRNLNSSGVSLSGSPTISNLSNGDFELAVSGGHLITLSSGVIDANASLVISGDRFATTTAITGYNVYLQGSTSNAWTFVSHTGNLAGEAYDFDGATACGSVRWSNSSCLITQETHYRYRNDDGGIDVPDSEWYNASWTERTTVRLTNNDATTYTNPVVHLHVTYDSDMNTDFSDLRFTSENGTTSIPYYIEKYTTGTDADIWVKVPTLAGNATTPIYMYYKNGSALTTTSSSTATFIASDDFEDGNISEYSGDTSLFSVNTNHVDGGTYGLDNAGNTTARATNGIARFDHTVSQGEQLRYKQYVNTSGGADEVCSMFGVQSPVTAIHNYGVCLEQVVGQDYMAIVKNVDHSAVPANTLASTSVTYSTGWYEVDINWKTDNSIFVSLYDSSGALVATTTATDSTYTSGGYGFTFWYDSGGWDSYFVRPVFDTEPTVHYGAKQTDGGASWASALDSPVTLSSGDAIRMRTSVENSGLQITNQTFDLEYAQKGAAPSCEAVSNANYATVPVAASCGSSPLCMATSSHVTNNSNTTDLLLGPSGEFTQGKVVTDPSYTTSALTLDQDAYTELEYVLKTTIHATSSAYCMRVTDGGTPVDTYLSVPELDIKFDPTVSALTLNDGQDITLTPGATTTIYATGTVSDFNGYTDLATATGTIYRSGAGALCSPNENDCYRATGAQCQFSNCSGNSCEISCQADINYFADPTDSGTYAGEEWIAYVEAADHEGGIGVGSAPGVELLSLRALNVSSAINYGSLAVASSTGAFNPTTTVANVGNSVLDLQVEGTDLSDGAASTIPASEQLFATSSFSYSACTYCTTLSTTSTQFNLDLTKPTSTAPVTGTIYWGIYVPFGVSAAAHHGTNTFYATGP